MDLFDKFEPLIARHEQILQAGRDPFGVCMEEIRSATEAVIEGREVILAGTNNYLGLTFDPQCIAAAQDALAREGTGTTGSRIANGTYADHRNLERKLASFFGCRSAMIYPTGYQANLGTLATLAGPGDYIFLDAHGHACIYDGCRMSGATVIRFRHNSPEDLTRRLERLSDSSANKLIVVEGLYSMFGDIAPLAEFTEIKRHHGAYLYVDEAHSVGVFGEGGRGVAELAGVADEVDFVAGTFSKSLGSIGGFCASNHPRFECLRFANRPYMFTASLSPANVASASMAVSRIQSDPSLMRTLWRNVEVLYERFQAMGLSLAAPPSPVIAVQLSNQEEAVFWWNRLIDAGIYVNLAVPPGTPDSSSLLRCSVSAAHSVEQIDRIGDAFESVALEARSFETRMRRGFLADGTGE